MDVFSTANVVGTWRVVRTEIPAPYERGEEFFHFSADGVCAWEHPFIEQPQKVFPFHYTLTESGARLTNRKGEYPREVPMRWDGELLVITGPHGYSSWLQRIPTAERLPLLSRFHEPPASMHHAQP